MPTITRTAVLIAAAAALIISTTTAQAAPTGGPNTAPQAGETVTQPLQAALKSLTIKDEDRTGYHRTSFKHWVDADKDGCTTRAEVLKAEALTAPEQGSKCKLTDGNRCDYVSQWVAIKTRWKLTIDPSEEAALAENATRCPNTPVKVQLAR